MKQSRIILRILDQIHAEGYQAGTPQFEFVLKKRKVEECQDRQRVPSCQACRYFDNCELAHSFFRDVATIELQDKINKKIFEEREKSEKDNTEPDG